MQGFRSSTCSLLLARLRRLGLSFSFLPVRMSDQLHTLLIYVFGRISLACFIAVLVLLLR